MVSLYGISLWYLIMVSHYGISYLKDLVHEVMSKRPLRGLHVFHEDAHDVGEVLFADHARDEIERALADCDVLVVQALENHGLVLRHYARVHLHVWVWVRERE
jgi:hypothetical protein